MAFDVIDGLLRPLVTRLLEMVGLEGVVAGGTLISALLLLWWGIKVSWFARAGSRYAGSMLRYLIVSLLFTLLAIGGGLYLEILPAVNVDRLVDLVVGAVR